MEAAFGIGRHRVFRIEEWQGGFSPPDALFAEYEDAAFAAQAAAFEPAFFRDGMIYGYLQSWLIDTGTERIIVDTGAGNGKDRPGIPIFGNLGTPFLAGVEAAGFAASDIDKVFCTHLHVDHVGWNTEWRGASWQPTFPNARYYFPRADEAAWNPEKPLYATLAGAGVNANVFEDSVRPIIDAGLAELIDDGAEIATGMRAWAFPGHTPGHMILEVEDQGESALFTGDILHHPMQVLRPDWNSVYCEDRVQAAASRRHLLDRASARGARIVPAHFGAPHSLFVKRSDDGAYLPHFA